MAQFITEFGGRGKQGSHPLDCVSHSWYDTEDGSVEIEVYVLSSQAVNFERAIPGGPPAMTPPSRPRKPRQGVRATIMAGVCFTDLLFL